jgi:hypothetical protein
MAKQTLPNEVKAFVVTLLACYDAPTVIAARVKQEFGLIISRQAVEKYDPEKRAGARLSPRWRELHAQARETFLREIDRIGISHRAVRLRALQRMAEKAEDAGSLQLAAQLYEQAAKEVGNAYTNKRELTGKDGQAVQHRVRTLADFYPEQPINSNTIAQEAAPAWAEGLQANPIPT